MLDWLWTALKFLDEHGTGLAAVAAFIGIPALIAQISQSSWQEYKRVRARRLAAVSTLPMTLHGINQWAKDAAASQTAVYMWAKRRTHGQQPPAYAPPPSPSYLIDAIERMIEAAPKDRIALTLGAIVSQIQVLSSRLAERDNFTADNISGQQWSIDDNLVRAAAIYSLAESLYDDARALSDEVSLDFSRMIAALNLMDVRDGNHEEVHKLALKMAAKAERERLARRRGYARLGSWITARAKGISTKYRASSWADRN